MTRTNQNETISVSLKNKIEAYDMSFVFDKLVRDRKVAKSDIKVLEKEFKRFVLLAGLGIFPIAMISPLVDEVWHQFILFTKQYRDFCYDTIGFFLEHTPDTVMTPIPKNSGENFRLAYIKHFGIIPSIWFKKMDAKSLNYYSQPPYIGTPPKLWSGWAGPQK